MRDSRLPVTADPYPDERLTQWITRVASLNRTTTSKLLGGRTPGQRLDRWTHPQEIDRLSELTHLSADQLYAMTAQGRFPGAPPECLRDPRDVTCVGCRQPGGVSALLGLLPTCARCGHILLDASGYTEAQVDPHLVRLHGEVKRYVRANKLGELARRVDRLRDVVRQDWPPPPAHEPPERLRSAIQQLRLCRATWSPVTAAVLLVRAIDIRGYFAATRRYQRYATGWWPTPDEVDPAPLADIPTEMDRLHDTIRRHGLEPEHVPLAMKFGVDGLQLPPGILDQREAWAVTLREQVEHATGRRVTMPPGFAKPELAWPMDDPRTIRLFTDAATALHRDGLVDRLRAHHTFWERWTVPNAVVRQLPPAVRDYWNVEHAAAAWVWLTTTGAGGLPLLENVIIEKSHRLDWFDEALNPEGRLVLLDYAANEFDGWVDAAVGLAKPTLASTTAGSTGRVG